MEDIVYEVVASKGMCDVVTFYDLDEAIEECKRSVEEFDEPFSVIEVKRKVVYTKNRK